MKRILMICMVAAALGLAWPASGQMPHVVKGDDDVCGAVPSEKQLQWHAMEEMAFVHFNMNTFTGKEWGYGDEQESTFNPTDMDAEQIVRAVRDAGLKGLILTAKHHDGFCLWPSHFTTHTIQYSSYRGVGKMGTDIYGKPLSTAEGGQPDIVREFADACAKYGIKFGIYLSPWDRNRSDYATSLYIDYYRSQLTELLRNYGPIFEIWFDGANGGDGYYGGQRKKLKINANEYYQWEGTVDLIHLLSPNTLIFSGMYPDARWCGNESGYAAETNWCTGDADIFFRNNQEDTYLLHHGIEDAKHWIPCEVDVSIRPGWFYHPDEQPKTGEQLFQIYLTSVGRNGNLLLNLAPDTRGQIPDADVAALRRFRAIKDSTFRTDVADSASVLEESSEGGAAMSVALTWNKPIRPHYVVLQEDIAKGQRVRLFEIQVPILGQWVTIGRGTTIGHKRIIEVSTGAVSEMRVLIINAKAEPRMLPVEVYE
jgi:alpha-L-fucosidase